jgi:cytochrome P450
MATLAKHVIDKGEVDPLDVSRAELYTNHLWEGPFRQLRAEAPVYRCEHSEFGAYWSVSSYKAIQHVESLPDIYSSSWEYGGITIADRDEFEHNIQLPMFIAMDRPKHTEQRRTVSPAFTPAALGRGVRLGRQGVDRADHRYARPAVRLPLGRPPQAHLLVRLGR